MYVRGVIASRTSTIVAAAALGAVLFASGPSHAHFILTAPAAAHEQSAYGDPQKAPPCGDDGSAVATGMITEYKGGDTITITIDETIYHPGHYRVAIAQDPSQLPEEPPVTPNDTPCGTAPIDPAPAFPVLADGVLVHTEPFAQPQSFEVKLPEDLECDSCTLQVIQFMSDHGLNNPGGCYYHHCANIAVVPLQSPDGTSGGEASTGGAEGTAPSPTTGAGEATGEGDTAGSATAGGGSTGAATATGDVVTATATTSGATTDAGEGDSGCSCAAHDGGPAALGLFALLGLGRRRRTRG